MATKQPTFRELSDQLEEVVARLQDESVDVDEALKLHEKGTVLLDQLEKRLTAAEHKVVALKPKRA